MSGFIRNATVDPDTYAMVLDVVNPTGLFMHVRLPPRVYHRYTEVRGWMGGDVTGYVLFSKYYVHIFMKTEKNTIVLVQNMNRRVYIDRDFDTRIIEDLDEIHLFVRDVHNTVDYMNPRAYKEAVFALRKLMNTAEDWKNCPLTFTIRRKIKRALQLMGHIWYYAVASKLPLNDEQVCEMEKFIEFIQLLSTSMTDPEFRRWLDARTQGVKLSIVREEQGSHLHVECISPRVPIDIQVDWDHPNVVEREPHSRRACIFKVDEMDIYLSHRRIISIDGTTITNHKIRVCDVRLGDLNHSAHKSVYGMIVHSRTGYELSLWTDDGPKYTRLSQAISLPKLEITNNLSWDEISVSLVYVTSTNDLPTIIREVKARASYMRNRIYRRLWTGLIWDAHTEAFDNVQELHVLLGEFSTWPQEWKDEFVEVIGHIAMCMVQKPSTDISHAEHRLVKAILSLAFGVIHVVTSARLRGEPYQTNVSILSDFIWYASSIPITLDRKATIITLPPFEWAIEDCDQITDAIYGPWWRTGHHSVLQTGDYNMKSVIQMTDVCKLPTQQSSARGLLSNGDWDCLERFCRECVFWVIPPGVIRTIFLNRIYMRTIHIEVLNNTVDSILAKAMENGTIDSLISEYGHVKYIMDRHKSIKGD